MVGVRHDGAQTADRQEGTGPLTTPSTPSPSSSSAFRTVPRAADVVIIGGGVMGTSIAFHLAAAGARAGVVFATHTDVTGIDTAGDRVTAVHTDRGPVSCSTVICAAGAWSGRIGDLAGVPLPVRPVRRQLAFTEPLTPPAPRIPFTIDFSSSAYFHNS